MSRRAAWAVWARLLALLVLGAAVGVALFAAVLAWAQHTPGGEALRYPWEATRAFFFEGANPYHRLTLLYRWAALQGSRVAPDVYFFPVALIFYGPLALVGTFAWARAVAAVGLVAGWVAAGLLGGQALRWRGGRGLAAVLLFFALTWFFAALTLVTGDVVGWVWTLLVLALAALLRGRDTLVGAALALALIRPEVAGLPVVFLLLWALVHRRWRVWAGFWGVLLLSAAVAFWLLPSWPLAMLRLILKAAPLVSPRLALAQAMPGIGSRLGQLMVGLVALNVLMEWWAAASGSPRHAVWATALSAWGGLLLGTRVVPAAEVMLLLPLGVVWFHWAARWRAYGRHAVLLTAALFWALPWFLWRDLLRSPVSHWPRWDVFFLLPLGIWPLLYAVRWWATRPHALLDEAS